MGNKRIYPTLFDFDNSNSGVKNENLSSNSSELDYFLALFDDEIVNVIIENTNLYAKQQNASMWKDIDKRDLFIFIALTLLMPYEKNTMSRDRYLQILRNLHFQDNEMQVPPNNRLHKMGPILELIQRNFKRQLYPFQDVVIDESLILFKGRLHFKQYIKSKRHRFGIKLFVLCDCETAYILNFDVYVGKENEKSVNQEDLVYLVHDNYYTSPALSTYLHKHKTNSCGTVRSNRKKLPKFEKKLKKGETEFRSSEHMLALKWKDRREVFMLSTMHENKMVTLPKKDRITGENIKKPLCVVDYNRKMGAVDKTDMMISSLDCTCKTIKWYKKLFMHIVTFVKVTFVTADIY
ncbi:hypothetical protein NQ318_007559 [Aromia moschata]|uniref:PiggyBac transposable element-derived protein domain-containing protein n=1 Tax=Aromia moschata TaxID=1265417 RepID=A0AAV8YEL8_9CUCU|nr:hypothetical protein NQ318_007559 [Aromia moschata]